MIDFGGNWNAVLHASARDENYQPMLASNPYLYITTRQDTGYSGAACPYINVVQIQYAGAATYKLRILGYNYYGSYFASLSYLAIYDDDFEHIGANQNRIIQY